MCFAFVCEILNYFESFENKLKETTLGITIIIIMIIIIVIIMIIIMIMIILIIVMITLIIASLRSFLSYVILIVALSLHTKGIVTNTSPHTHTHTRWKVVDIMLLIYKYNDWKDTYRMWRIIMRHK